MKNVCFESNFYKKKFDKLDIMLYNNVRCSAKNERYRNAREEMELPRFFVPRTQICDNIVTVIGDDAHHIARSLRMAVGEHITVCDMQTSEYECELLEFDDDRTITARILYDKPLTTESPLSITLYQALPKGDKLDMIIQKAVECGVSRIVPFESDNCVVRVKQDAETRKTERRNRIALEAAKQCGRGLLPVVEETISFNEMITQGTKADLMLFCYEGEGVFSLKDILRQYRESLLQNAERPSIAIVIGSEGGFTPAEARMACDKGSKMVNLGPRILRTETASCFVLSSLAYEFEL